MDILKENVYADFIKKNVSKVLTQIDRDRNSKTYGSCDRNYWHLKIRDFSSAILQQTCLTLALLYKVHYKNSIYYQNENIREWSVAILRYMRKIQLKDGSFNEYYPNEHGFPPTAFNLFAGCKTYLELGLEDNEIMDMLSKTAKWLCNHDETKAYNQEIAAIAGLYLFYMISGDTNVLSAVSEKVDKILAVQSIEGWFPEQGGADIGYSSVAFDMLTEYYSASNDKRVIEPINKLLDFLSYFVHPDGTIGGEYGSRNTIYFMPNGLENYISLGLDNENKAASMIQMIYEEGPKKIWGDFMEAVDERYLTHYVMHSYLRALQKFQERQKVIVQLPFNTIHIREFTESGLLSFYNGKYFAIVSGKKGGIIKVYNNDKEIFWDCGYRIPIQEGCTATTNWLDSSYVIEVDNNIIFVKGCFNKIKPKIQTPIYHLGLRLSAMFMGDKVNHLIKKLTIFQNKHFNADFNRKIMLNDNEIIIRDDINNPGKMRVFEAPNVSLRLVASGKFFSRSDLLRTDLKFCGNNEKINISKHFDVESEKLEVEIG